MSYDIELDCELEKPHHLKGGTYCLGGTTRPHLNITYNYADHYYRVFGERGIRAIYGMTASESIPILEAAIEKLAQEPPDEDYWKPTEGNARAALVDLLMLARMAISEGKGSAKWEGD